MATLADYKGLDVVEGATGDGGIALTDNFKELADRAPYQSSSNPTTSSDSSAGFAAGDQWLNTSTQVMWVCVSASAGAAVWKSAFKRSAGTLELIPAESGDTVQVEGALQVDGEAQFTSKVGIADGAVTAPSLVFGSDSDTGIYRISENTLGVSTAGNERVRVGSDGLVSIGKAISVGPPVASAIDFAAKFAINVNSGAGVFVQNSSLGTVADSRIEFIDTGYQKGVFLGLPSSGNTVTTFGMPRSSLAVLIAFALSGMPRHLAIGTSGASDVVLGTSNAERLRISSTGAVSISGDTLQIATEKTPASASAAGDKGTVCWDDNYVYVCTAANTWKRAALSTW